MPKYKKCPRCDLNYIPVEEEMCDVCKAELGLATNLVLLDDIMDDDEPLKPCPVCHTTFIGIDEKMCESCLAAEQQSKEINVDDDNDDEWRTYLDDEDTEDANDEPLEIPLEDLEKDFADEDDEEEFEDEENVEEDEDEEEDEEDED